MKQKEVVHKRVKQYAMKDFKAIYQELNSGESGLRENQVAEYRKLYGYHELASHDQDSFWHCLSRAFVNPFSTILFFLGVISFITDILLTDGFGNNLTTVIIIFTMLIISGTIRLVQELRSKKIADSLTQLVHTTVQVLRNGIWQEINSEELVVGDQVRVEAGDLVPADIRLINTGDLFVSQSVITGESTILEKTERTLVNKPESITDYNNTIFHGTTVTGGWGTGIVLAVGKDTVYGGYTPSNIGRKHGFDKGANSIAGVLIRFMAVLIPVVFLASGLTKGNWLEAFLFALSVAVGLTPEMLPMVVNACLAKGSFSMGQKQTVIKNINAMQGFGSMDTLCVDKTGTLTGDQVILEYYMDILGNESQKVLDYAYLNSYYHIGVKNHLDTAISKVRGMPEKEAYYAKLVQQHTKADGLPFDYNRKFASVLLHNEGENLLIVKGSVDEVVRQCRYFEYRDQITEAGKDAIQNAYTIVDEMLEDGMKVIAVAYKNVAKDHLTVEEESDFILLGYLAFFDAPKKSAASAATKLRNLHVNIKVLTGDQKKTALSVCRRLGISSDLCMTGTQIEALSENEFPMIIEKTNIFAELSPKQKSVIIESLQNNGHTVGFLGDGVNDLPAVLQADVGISVGNAVEAVKDSADVILMKKDLNVLEEGILEGRKSFANMSKYIKITASSNLGNICAVVIASVLLPFFPMTSIQLLLLNLLYDTLCLVLPWDNVDWDLLEKPLEWSGRTLGRFMIFFGLISSVFDIITFVFLYFFLCPAFCGGYYAGLDVHKQALFVSLFQTGWFLESMWTQVLILQLLRTKRIPFVQSRPSNAVMIVILMGITVFTLLTTTPVGGMIGLTAMPAVYYLFLVIDVVFYLLFVTLAKAFYLKKEKNLL